MENIYSAEELLAFNSDMLGRGAPDKEDNMGYNKPDFSVCANYFMGATDSQLADLSKRLIKYNKTQLNVDADKLVETNKHFEAKAKGIDPKMGVSIDVQESHTAFHFRFNYNFIDVIKKLNKSKRYFDWKSKVWLVKNDSVIETLKNLENVGADTKNAIEFAKLNIKENDDNRKSSTEPDNIVKINVEDNGDKIDISFDFRHDIVKTIKTIDRQYRHWNPDKKTWSINKKAVVALSHELRELKNIDLTELKSVSLPKKLSVINGNKEVVKLNENYNKIFNPYPHQVEGAKFLLKKQKAILGDDMGLGKTVQSIMALNSLKGKKLIVCPASLKLNWRKEILLVSKDADIQIAEGKKLPKVKKSGWLIINYDILNKHLENILKEEFKGVALDEAHYMKAISNSGNPDSKRARASMKICQKIDFTFLLTGTPITNKTKDIFNLLKAVNHPLSTDFRGFAHTYCDATYNGWGWDYNGSSNREELNNKIQSHMIRRLKEDLLDLPKKVRSFIPVEVDTKKYYQKVNEYMQQRESISDNGEHLVYLNALRSILAQEKISHTIKLAKDIVEQDESVVIFANYKFEVNELMKAFPQAVKVTGDENSKERQDAVDKFQNGEVKVIICNLVAGGVGITLTRAKNMIISSFSWNPVDLVQGEDRIYRIGQDSSVNIKYVYSEGTFDEKMANMIEEKLSNINKIVDGKDEGFINELIASF